LEELKMSVLFMKINNFDNSECVREPILPKGAIHAWAVLENDYKSMSLMYPNHELIESKGKEIYAIDFSEIDDYVTGESDEMPPLEEFDPLVHNTSIRKGDYQIILV
jgi:hypothetical protein